MPTTFLEYPILLHFLCTVKQLTGMPAISLDTASASTNTHDDTGSGEEPRKLPKGVVLGPDGKP
jgi:FAD-linked sulfhydryl oxidase